MLHQKRTTTERGLGYHHQKQVEKLFRYHIDGTVCWWCGQPMYVDPTLNFDCRKLQGDHSIARSKGGTIADRLLHATCNRDRGDGSHDDDRPALTGEAVEGQPEVGLLLMGWP